MLRGSAGSDINMYYICLKTEERLFQKPVRDTKTTVIVKESNQYKRAYTGESEKKLVVTSLEFDVNLMYVCPCIAV